MRFFDLSLEIGPNLSEPVPVEIDYISHAEGADILGKPIGIGREQFPNGMGLSLEHVKLTSHTGTHVDAPIHYGPLSEGKPAKSISELPLHWFYSDGVVLDCIGTSEDGDVSKHELVLALAKISYQLKPLDIVLINTGADQLWGKPEYFTDFRGISKEATEWLVAQGIKVIGIDSFGFDKPFHLMLKAYQASQEIEHLWPAHFFGREKEYCQIERLANLSELPMPCGFKVCCFPIKLKDCGAGWSRVVAIYKGDE